MKTPPVEPLSKHVSAAMGVPEALVRAWGQQFGPGVAVQLCQHSLQHAPIVVAVEPGFDMEVMGVHCSAHAQPGFVVWEGDTAKLGEFLSWHPTRRVQDVAASQAVASTADLPLKRIIDACAGRGTKTVQLRAMHPNAEIVALEPDRDRLNDLRARFEGDEQVMVLASKQVDPTSDKQGGADLLLLDVPCSNTAVLARRPEARYRYTPAKMKTLGQLQRQIFANHLNLLRPGGYILYTTCSLLDAENREVARWIAQQHDCRVLDEQTTLPDGSDASYHDGAYHALLQWGGTPAANDSCSFAPPQVGIMHRSRETKVSHDR